MGRLKSADRCQGRGTEGSVSLDAVAQVLKSRLQDFDVSVIGRAFFEDGRAEGGKGWGRTPGRQEEDRQDRKGPFPRSQYCDLLSVGAYPRAIAVL